TAEAAVLGKALRLVYDPGPVRRPQVPRAEVPGAPARHVRLTGTNTVGINNGINNHLWTSLICFVIVTISNPFPDIAVHITKPKRIRKLGADVMRLASRITGKPRIVAELLLIATK